MLFHAFQPQHSLLHGIIGYRDSSLQAIQCILHCRMYPWQH